MFAASSWLDLSWSRFLKKTRLRKRYKISRLESLLALLKTRNHSKSKLSQKPKANPLALGRMPRQKALMSAKSSRMKTRFSIFLMAGGFAATAKTTTFTGDQNAIGAWSQSRSQTSTASPNICSDKVRNQLLAKLRLRTSRRSNRLKRKKRTKLRWVKEQPRARKFLIVLLKSRLSTKELGTGCVLRVRTWTSRSDISAIGAGETRTTKPVSCSWTKKTWISFKKQAGLLTTWAWTWATSTQPKWLHSTRSDPN